MTISEDRGLQMALHRYQIIAPFLAEELPRGSRGPYLAKLAEQVWTTPNNKPVQYSAETLRVWVRKWRQRGFEGLKNTERSTRGTAKALEQRIIDEACRLKEEVPARSIKRIIKIMEDLKFISPGQVQRSTLHRALKAKGLSARRLKTPENKDLDRWQADFANDIWQADMLFGPWLPDPDKPGSMKRTYLYAFIDDASRLLLHGRFSFKGDLPALELVFRRALQRWGVPRKVYYDNGMTFRSVHMKQICAETGIHGIIFTKPRRPMGHGKIEALNRFCRNAFIEEVKASNIRTLDQLNEAFFVWADDEYNRREHSELKTSPLQRWQQDSKKIRFVDEEKLRHAFQWSIERTADKCGIISLFAVKYQVSSKMAGKRVQIRYDPDYLDEVEIWHKGKFIERISPYEITTHRRPRLPEPEMQLNHVAKTDWLGHIVQRRRERLQEEEGQITSEVEAEHKRKDETDRQLTGFLHVLRQRLHPDVMDDLTAGMFFRRFGPFDPLAAVDVIDEVVKSHGPDQHISVYLQAVQKADAEPF